MYVGFIFTFLHKAQVSPIVCITRYEIAKETPQQQSNIRTWSNMMLRNMGPVGNKWNNGMQGYVRGCWECQVGLGNEDCSPFEREFSVNFVDRMIVDVCGAFLASQEHHQGKLPITQRDSMFLKIRILLVWHLCPVFQHSF